MYIDQKLLFSKFCSILILSCSLSLLWGGGGGGEVVVVVITESHPTFCCVGVEGVLGCDNIGLSVSGPLQVVYKPELSLLLNVLKRMVDI